MSVLLLAFPLSVNFAKRKKKEKSFFLLQLKIKQVIKITELSDKKQKSERKIGQNSIKYKFKL